MAAAAADAVLLLGTDEKSGAEVPLADCLS